MPYKRHEDVATWNRAYQQRRSATERRDRATIEGRIIELAREQPGQHTVLTLYEILQKEGYPVRMVEKAAADLYHSGVLRWDLNKRLILHDREDSPFLMRQPAAAPGSPESE